MRLVFLDIDGVLNKGLIASASPAEDIIRSEFGWMNRSLVANFNALVALTGAKIVISSSWRCQTLAKTREVLRAFDVSGEIIGQTPELGSGFVRGHEIQAWIDENAVILGATTGEAFTSYVILDDSAVMLPHQQPHYVKTDPFVGLSVEMQEKAAALLCRLDG
tara:strand:+ start:125 stop:613 length:489 start_codon:yes stop_codon:yes gene_type:complete